MVGQVGEEFIYTPDSLTHFRGISDGTLEDLLFSDEDERKGTQLKRGTMSCVPFYLLPFICFSPDSFSPVPFFQAEFVRLH